MGNDLESSLTAAEIRTLHRIAGIMIPADAAHGMPAANDPVIFADIVQSLGRDFEEIRTALAALIEAGFIDLGATEGEAAAIDFLSVPSRAATALGRCVLQCYYRDDRVLTALGHEARAPFPEGNILEQGDWSLLDAVKVRAPFWRDDRRA